MIQSNDLFYIDQMQLYFGFDYDVNEKIHLHQPTIREITAMGEKSYYSMVHTLTATPSDMKATLWDSGIDWEEIEDYELFLQLAPTLSKEKTGIIFGDVDFSTMQLFRNRENDEIVLMDLERDICIDRLIYEKIVSYLRKVHNLKRKVEKAKNKRTKQIMIQVDRDNMRLAQTKEYKSFMLPLISSVKVKMGYTRDYVLDMKIVEFMDDLQRLQIIDHAFHLSNGAYCGMVDTSKIPKEQMNWLREL